MFGRREGDWKSLDLLSVEKVEKTEALHLLPEAETREEARSTISDSVFAGQRYVKVDSPIEAVILAPENFDHALRRFDAHREVIAAAVVPTIVRPNEIWLQRHPEGQDEIHYIKAFRGGRTSGVIVCALRRNQSGNSLVTFYEMWKGRRGINYVNRIRKGVLVYGG